MLPTRIPTANRVEKENDFIQRIGDGTYSVEDPSGRILKTGLTKREVVEFTWLSSGRDYDIRPRMGTLYDAYGRDTGEAHQLAGLFGPEWDVFFKASADGAWELSRFTAFGGNHREALVSFLDEAFTRRGWAAEYIVAGREM